MNLTIVILTPLKDAGLERLMAVFKDQAKVVIVRNVAELSTIEFDNETTLLSFGSGVIVSKDILSKQKNPAYNVHAASPEFPGRDPHHHAIYRGADTYGATLHIMTEKVDAGPIVAIESFSIEEEDRPEDLLARANEAGFALLERVGSRLLFPDQITAIDNVKWGKKKTSRYDMLRLCTLTPLISEQEFDKRYRAFDGGDFNNLTVRLHDQTFRIDKKKSKETEDKKKSFEDFTETSYQAMLQQLKANNYRFVLFGDKSAEKQVLWRHDVDISMHRAYRLARIEAEEGVVATYFVNPHSHFYNLLEPEIEDLLTLIREFGHEIGLHFDAGAYRTTKWTKEKLERSVKREKSLLEMILKQPVRSMSWHNPDLSNLLDFDDDEICGMINAYSASIKRDYVYCSDSNGYWRYQPMHEVIGQGHDRLHLLTHPGWWTVDPLSPSARIDRAIMGRARNVRSLYDEILSIGNRKNIDDL